MATTLHITMPRSLRDNTLKLAKRNGYSSLQKLTREVLMKLAEGKLKFGVAVYD